jgi:hypothetical protein
MHVRSALLRVVALYNAAILLPGPWNENLSSELTKAEIKKAELDVVLLRTTALPLQFYFEVFDPLEKLPPSSNGGNRSAQLNR